MNAVLLHFDLDERRRIASGALAPLSASLRAELDPLVAGSLPIPERKARLTRSGGRCALDGVLLRFDPYNSEEHECPQCHRVYTSDAHHDWWAMGAQLWSAERAAQAAAVGLLASDAAATTVSICLLKEFAVRYTSWPNRDNALGPTRPFFSTYLESIWLLNICHAIALLEQGPLDARAQSAMREIRNMLIEPSRALITSFNEGRSNRQVWNEVAILAASHILGDTHTVDARLRSSDGLLGLIANGLLDDGTWYEGENYHLFAHRGLWYGVQLLRAMNRPLAAPLNHRYSAGFVAPFLGLLPDNIFPSRRDSQYKVSIQQWRFAEWCELGIAHTGSSPQLSSLLKRLYDDRSQPAVHAHHVSTADAERNEQPGALSRADLSWRALLMANEDVSASGEWRPASVCLPAQGLAVLRRDEGRTYVALEGGHTGGGHGHPDRLALTLQHDRSRWLEDPGTGSYVEQTLHWYRSTLAHFAPLFDGVSQLPVPATLLAFEERGGAGWISKRVEDIAPGVSATRTLVAGDSYVVDVLEWQADSDRTVSLPLARATDVTSDVHFAPHDALGGEGLEDGFDFLTDVSAAVLDERCVTFTIPGATTAKAHYGSSHDATLWRADAPGSPGHPRAPLHWIRTRAAAGRIVGVWQWNDHVQQVRVDASSEPPLVEVTTAEGTTAQHSRTPEGWHIQLQARHATSSIDLVALAQPACAIENSGNADRVITRPAIAVPQLKSDIALDGGQCAHPIARAIRYQLGEQHYVRTETSWPDAGRPVAIVQIGATETHLIVDVLARTGTIVVPAVHDENTLDNERRDVNADGLQIHIGPSTTLPWSAAWLIVPAPETAPQARVSDLIPKIAALTTEWKRTGDGWAMRVGIPRSSVPANSDGEFRMEIIVNERSPDRQRRRGQLVLSGGGGFGYLRGDRSDPAHAGIFRLPGHDGSTLTASHYL